MKQLLAMTIMLLIAGSTDMYAQKQGETAPDFEVGLLGGEMFKLSDHEGKVVFVFFFGNTCPSCRAVGSIIESSINQEFHSDSANFTAVGIDTWDASSNESSVTGFKNSTGITFPLAIKGGQVAGNYQTTYDRLMVIDKDGVLVHKGLVVASNDIDNAIAAIEQSLVVTGINNSINVPQLRVYPNPVSDRLFIRAGEESVSGIMIFDVTGKMMLESAFPEGQASGDIELTVDELESGVYFYSIQTEGEIYTGKILIQE